ncbi:adenylate kinase isoenzyme 1-like [Aricia agestis]|uniref:adenylate kinase isoenzyme 1-like n=1 Tax=Aricia agestis TaxID=91739 RepID=UPI001C2069F7|nr:adenylate kinase isoenzyme 1-like [Aricia agestis]
MGCFYSRRVENDSPYDMSPIRHLPVIFVNGVPGAGSQTVAETIATMTGYTTVRPGDLLRHEAARDTTRGRLVADRMRAQEEIPDQLTVDLIKESMLQQQDATGFILVGFPRTRRMSSIFNRQVKCPEKIVALEVDDEVAATRLQNKLSELGRPASEVSSARQIVRRAASNVRSVHKRHSGHVVTVNSADNPTTLASTLKEMLSDMIQDKKEPQEDSRREENMPDVTSSPALLTEEQQEREIQPQSIEEPVVT